MRSFVFALVLLFLTGCEGGWHPLDCAMGNSYSPTWCPPGTLGYNNQMNGQGKDYSEGLRTIAAAAATGAVIGSSSRPGGAPVYPIQAGSQQALVTQIDGSFEGWSGTSIYKLAGGRVIQQAEYHYHYHYAFSPRVVIYQSNAGLKIHIDGDSDQDVGIRFLQ